MTYRATVELFSGLSIADGLMSRLWRHGGLVFHEAYSFELPAGHRFPMPKFAALMRHLHASGLTPLRTAPAPVPVDREALRLAHSASYVDRVLNLALAPEEQRRLGLPLSPALVQRARAAVGGTILACRLALAHGFAANTAGGSHHALRDGGAGFCVFNDVAVALRTLQAGGEIRRALVVDLDVHQGDGTAEILAGDTELLTFSVHCRTNFPARKQQSSVDLSLDPGTGDDAYLASLAALLEPLLQRTRPDLVVYNAGVDPHAADRLGRLALSDHGLRRRDHMVLSACAARGLPVAVVVGGGYDDDLEALVRRHAIVHEVARELCSR